jgi:hypothetical protein
MEGQMAEFHITQDQEQFRKSAEQNGLVVPTNEDNAIIPELVQAVIDLVQSYGRDKGLTYPGAMSALVSAGGALVGQAYDDAGTRRQVCQSMVKGVLAYSDMVANYRARTPMSK